MAITLTSNFECGNGNNANISGNDVEFDGENSEYFNSNYYGYWFYVRLDGVDGTTPSITVNMTNDIDIDDCRPVYSFDQSTWVDVASSWNGTTDELTFTLPAISGNSYVYIAYSIPYSYSDLQGDISTWSGSSYVTVTDLGDSQQSRNMYYIKIDDEGSTKTKVNIFITARAHPAETLTSNYMKGFIDWIIGSSDNAEEFRSIVTLHIMPMINPDGVYNGWQRKLADNTDANRQYDSVNGPDSGDEADEVYLFHLKFDSINSEVGIDFFMDMHNSASNAVYLGRDSSYFSASLETLMESFLVEYDVPDFWDHTFNAYAFESGTTGLPLRDGVGKQYSIDAFISERTNWYRDVSENRQGGIDIVKAIIKAVSETYALPGVTWGSDIVISDKKGAWSDWVEKETTTEAQNNGDYELLQINNGKSFVSTVVEFNDALEKTFSLSVNDYGSWETGTAGTLYIRGRSTTFDQDDNETVGPVWTAYTVPVSQAWKYAQAMIVITGTAPTVNDISQSDPSVWYRFESGTGFLDDSSANGNDLTAINGGPSENTIKEFEGDCCAEFTRADNERAEIDNDDLPDNFPMNPNGSVRSWTLTGYFEPKSTPGYMYLVSKFLQAGDLMSFAFIINTDDNFSVLYGYNNGASFRSSNIETTGTITTGDRYWFYVTYDGDTDRVRMRVYDITAAAWFEAEDTYDFTGYGAMSAEDTPLCIGGRTDNNIDRAADSYLDSIAFWPHVKNTADWDAMVANTWAYQRQLEDLTLGASIAETTITATKGNLNIAGINPTIDLGVTIETTKGNLNVASINPAITVANIISATKGNLNITGINPGILAGIIISATKESLNVSGINPTIDIGAIVEATTGNLNVAGVNPSVSTGIFIDSTIGTLSITSINPDVTTETIVDVAKGNLNIASVNPLVQQTIAVESTKGNLSIVSIDPSITLATVVNATIGNLNVSGVNPSVKQTIVIDSTKGNLNVSGINPTIDTSLLINATLGTLAINGIDPSVIIGVTPEVPLSRIYAIDEDNRIYSIE